MDYFGHIPEDDRLTTYPIGRPDLYKYVEEARASFWTTKEIDISADRLHYKSLLNDGERRCVDHILAFFAASDGIVNINLAKRFMEDVKLPEAINFYNMQLAMEDIHAEMYSLLLVTCVEERDRQQHLLNAAEQLPAVKKMTKFITDTIDSSAPFGERLMRMVCVEGVFFQGPFCIIYWFASRGLMPGLGQSNVLISRDEGLHTTFGIVLLTLLRSKYRPTNSKIREIMAEAVDIAMEFSAGMMPDYLEQMNNLLMTQYIKFVANNILARIGVPVLYEDALECPFDFMNKLNMVGRVCFFERRSTDYPRPCEADSGWNVLDDF